MLQEVISKPNKIQNILKLLLAGILFASVLTENEVLYCQRLLRRHCNYTPSCHLWLATQNHFQRIDGKHIPHICHNKACINVDHLSSETAAINNKRKICVSNGECTGHYGHKRCILRYKVICLYLCHMHVHERHQVLH